MVFWVSQNFGEEFLNFLSGENRLFKVDWGAFAAMLSVNQDFTNASIFDEF
jgi:hypothetical protein